MKKFDDVNGVIVGGDYQHVKLIAPNGNQARQAYIGSEESPIEWAKSIIKALLSEPCGTGKPLSEYPDIYQQIYGAGEFTVLTDR